jgi:hypothetical protein
MQPTAPSNAIVNCPNMLQEFVVHAVTEGIDALGEVTVRLQGEDPRRIEGEDEHRHRSRLAATAPIQTLWSPVPKPICRRSIRCWLPAVNTARSKKPPCKPYIKHKSTVTANCPLRSTWMLFPKELPTANCQLI